MLYEAFNLNQQMPPTASTDATYPVLCMTSLLKPSVIDTETFKLHTKTMILETPEGETYPLEFNNSEPTEETVQIWQTHVVGRFFGRNLTPRFMHQNNFTE